jgi:hypothetical protein
VRLVCYWFTEDESEKTHEPGEPGGGRWTLGRLHASMITNRYLPQWLHRLACGVVGAAVTVAIASAGLRYAEPDSWLRTASGVLLWLSIPVGVVVACVAPRFSIVEVCAGDVGYEDLDSEHEDKPSA